MKWRLVLCALAAVCLSPSVFALQFMSVKETGVAFYEAPTLAAKKLFVVSRYYPVEVLSTQRDWSRVRDATGGIAWIPSAALSTQRWVLVVTDKSVARNNPDRAAPVSFSLVKNSVLQLVEDPKDQWVKVRHRDGSVGYMEISDVWGL